ncbi:acetyl/propionyl/methylcrotonyl-CoA carboxylase subunit alpha [Altererythrobacter arenosus]|uniref:Acetyl/propionyl/methylcrotonyl-CoA carboxylase subunit alpha n=1 Tax=Altererythrobacter arenosus TaxID=3032592 RepID=A0ABY8FMG7_9SPHN|nr:acetyl/propionyl/methylcrotonyl-CoA carboxylase subunit alpha [Altererythrobacter sp. CAU 1644]WFL76215.1 acetyl/propionyl/methylcrotonyl-CoA carboxylase subunit alpha [Altererythrobacter sp. CAU 1644]
MISKLLIANRGEIACRIIRTAGEMGIATVAVYSDADAKALHVRSADEAVHIGPSPAAESYLVGEKIIAAAKETGAEAIHPGYGFLAENAGFARAVIDAGLIWVGPKPESIEAMGLKDAAKERMIAAGVPVTPGYLGEDQSVERLKKEADTIGYPVLIKAVAGGGGKGMRKVDAPENFEADLESCRREAKASFSNDEVLLEKWITSPRHIEVQVFGDSHGNVVHLFERDCSLQRRHQKVIEEAPAPGMDEATREEICAAAVRAAKAVDYEGAGTIEFIADASEGLRADRIFFMEMNTRLQVEHPVTEEITGVDLVEWQLRVASGEPIPLRQEELSINGWAIEARLYAEDPAAGFLPSTGRLHHFDLGEYGRIETGVEEGDAISPNYDPMIAKIIAHGSDRIDAIEGLATMLAGVEVWPVKTNAAFLLRCSTHPDFVEADLDTGFIARNEDTLIPGEAGEEHWRTAAMIGMAEVEDDGLAGLRLNASPRLVLSLAHKGERRTVDLMQSGPTLPASGFSDGDRVVMFSAGETHEFALASRDAGGHHAHDGDIIAPMPGKVIAVDVKDGDSVTAGQRLMVLEAMKMEHALTAPFDGTVRDLAATAGAQVQVEAVLAVIEPSDED